MFGRIILKVLKVKKYYKKNIVEGPDRSGKSTLVKKLKEELKWDAIYLGHRETSYTGERIIQKDRYINFYASLEGTVFDRSHISEVVYSKIYRREEIPFNDRKFLDYVASKDSIIIFALPGLETVLERYRNTPKILRGKISEEEIKKSYNLFKEEKENYWHETYTETTFEGLESFVKKIALYIQRYN